MCVIEALMNNANKSTSGLLIDAEWEKNIVLLLKKCVNRQTLTESQFSGTGE